MLYTFFILDKNSKNDGFIPGQLACKDNMFSNKKKNSGTNQTKVINSTHCKNRKILEMKNTGYKKVRNFS